MVYRINTANAPFRKKVVRAVEEVVLIIDMMAMGTEWRAVFVVSFLGLCGKDTVSPFERK